MRLRRFILTAAAVTVATLGLAAPQLSAQQQAKEPIALVSITNLERLMQDVAYLFRASNFPEIGGFVDLMQNQYTQGIDRQRPIGALVSLEGQMPSAVIFLPLNDRKKFFDALAGLGIEPDDLGEGLFEINANGQSMYAKDANGWIYLAQAEADLANVPADPSALLGDLPKRYDIAIRANVQALPSEIKDLITQQVRIGFERGMAEQRGQTAEERAAAEKMGEASIQQIEDLVRDTDKVIFGWAVDSAGQQTYIDTAAQFIAGSKLAQQAEAAKDTKSDYTTFDMPGSAAKFRFSGPIADSDKEVAKNNLRNSVNQIESQLDNLNGLPDSIKAILQELAKGLAPIVEKTIDEGVLDGAGSLSFADETFRVLIGGRVADGKSLADEFKKVLAKSSGNSKIPTFEFDYETYKGVSLHRASVPVKIADPAAKRVFGDELKVTIGTSAKGFMVAVDPTGDAALKAAIDRMAGAKGAAVTPFESTVELGKILSFAQAVSPNSILDNAVAAISSYVGKDRVSMNGNTIPRGAVYRLSVDEGVLKAIGTAAKSGSGGGGGF